MNISVVIPTKNEEKTVGEVIEGVKPFADEILVVDGHSTDKTRDIAKSYGVWVTLDNGKGKGDAIRLGVKEATGDVLVFIDADGSHDPRDIPKLIGPILEDQADHVGGSRMLGGSEELFGKLELFARQAGNAVITIGINWVCKVHITDSQNGFRAIRRDVALGLELQENMATIEEEMIIKTLRRGYRYVEVPTHEFRRKHGDSKINIWRDGYRFVYAWLKYLFFVK
ncbi:glycosyltransferase family 2 protein [Nitrospinae bacterium AH_259_B05_G02_I21]|nr:glycosyltransferase family 2 protein [Nitrospinae bacterium AH_259_B05_G02_I21]MDA2931667.1 glycosyltransferase family 2 protein [Nitrospinae bacterium AH-259-F20]